MRYSFLLLALALAGGAHAQGPNRSPNPSDADVINRALAEGKGGTRADASGSPYYFPHWTRGSVQLTTGTVPSPWLKYDLSTDNLLWRRAPNDSLLLDTSQMTEFTLGGDKGKPAVTFRRYLSSRIQQLELRTAFFEVLYDTKHSSLLRRSRRILMGSHSGPSLSGRTGGHWMNEDTYFIRRSDNVIEPVRLNTKAVLRVLGKTPALVAFVEREHLNLKQEAAIIQLLQYYDTQ